MKEACYELAREHYAFAPIACIKGWGALMRWRRFCMAGSLGTSGGINAIGRGESYLAVSTRHF